MLVDPEGSYSRIERLSGNAQLGGRAGWPCDSTSARCQGGFDRLVFVTLELTLAPGDDFPSGASQASSTENVPPSESMIARSMTFCSSRTFPGQS